MNLLKKSLSIFCFVCGVMAVALGVCLTTKASLGTTPITAIPWAIFLCLPQISFGVWVILFNLLLVAIEWILLREKLSLSSVIIQIILTFFFGYCIEFWMTLLAGLNPDAYWLRICLVLLGCLFIALGVCLNMISNVSVMPGDGFSIAIAETSKKQFARIRMLSDIAMSAIGLAICLVILNNMSGVREGTAIAAVATSCFVMLLLKGIAGLKRAKRRRALLAVRAQKARNFR